MIHSADDIRRLETRPYREFVARDTVLGALEDSAGRFADRRALSFIESPQPEMPAPSWTYREFLAAVRRAANLFHALGGPEIPRVALLLPPVPQAYFALWGAETAGIACPINYQLKGDQVAELVRACRASILVTPGPGEDPEIWSRVRDLRASCPDLRHVVALGPASDTLEFDAALLAQPDDHLVFQREVGADTVAAWFHTGGTTGMPKLARHSHGNQLHSAWGAARMYSADEHDVVLNGFPLFHVAGSLVYGLSTLLAGGELVLPPRQGLRNQAFLRNYWRFVEKHRVSLLAAVPTVMVALLNTPLEDAHIDSVRALFTGGSPLPAELASSFERQFGIPVRNILGMTECAGVISIEPFHLPRLAGSCGLPLPFCEVRAVNAAGQPCAAGEAGVLRVRGPNVGPGYTDPGRNAGTFTSDGWLITGDIGHVDAEGRVFVTGRAKDIIIRGGHNIDPGLIEEALLRHPDVQMAAAVGEPDEYAGEVPVVFVSLKPDAQTTPTQIAAFIEPFIAERPAMPKRIEILESIPVTAVGKVYKPALRARALQRVIEERLTGAGLADRVNACTVESATGLRLRLSLLAVDPGGELERRVRTIANAFAIGYDFEPLS